MLPTTALVTSLPFGVVLTPLSQRARTALRNKDSQADWATLSAVQFAGPYSGDTVNVQLIKLSRADAPPVVVQDGVSLNLSPPNNVVP